MIITSREGPPGKGGAGGAGVFIVDVLGLHGGVVEVEALTAESQYNKVGMVGLEL